MHASSILAVIAAVSFASATPVEYGLQARGNTPSKPADIHCSGEIIGYRAVDKKIKADQINLAKAFPKISPNGVDLGGDSVYFSNGLGDWYIGGTEVHWCIAYAETAKTKIVDKVWFPDDPKLEACTRRNDNNVNAWILTVSNNKFNPETTLRFSKLQHFHQVAIPFAALDKMEVCGKCYTIADAQKLKSQFPRVDYKSGPWAGSNTIKKRDALDPRAPAVCPLKSKPAPTPTPKGKPTPKPKGKASPKSKGKVTPKPKAARPKASRPEASKPKAKEPAKKEQSRA